MIRSIRLVARLLAGLCLVLGVLPAAAATIALPGPCFDPAAQICAPEGSGLGPLLFPALRDLQRGAPESAGDALLIVRGSSGPSGTEAEAMLALARLVTAISGRGDVRVWLLDTDRPGQPGLFCLRFERQTWTAGHMGDFALNLPQAAMIAARKGVLAMNGI